METKHTPGPWSVEPDSVEVPRWGGSWKHWSLSANTGRLMPGACDSRDTIHVCVARVSDAANARLIAAAPSLLAALESLVSPKPINAAEWSDAIRAARAAIARATGAAS